MRFRLLTFGGLRLEADGRAVTGSPAQRRRLALLTLLAANDQLTITREKAFGLLWPEQSTSGARRLLSESLYVLRRLVGEDVIRSATESSAARGDAVTAAEWWGRLAAHNPYSSRIASRYMVALASAGERARAIQCANIHTARLGADLGVEPDPGFRRRCQRFKNQLRIRHGGGEWRSRSRTAPRASWVQHSA